MQEGLRMGWKAIQLTEELLIRQARLRHVAECPPGIQAQEAALDEATTTHQRDLMAKVRGRA